jgi:hypothetical protein
MLANDDTALLDPSSFPVQATAEPDPSSFPVQADTLDPNTFPVQAEPLVPGTIDLDNRPVIRNKDGTVSTELSKSFNIDGQEVLIPTVVGGKIVTDQQAIEHYKQTGEHLGIFASPKIADAYANKIHKRFDARDQAEIARYGEVLTDDQRRGIAVQGPPMLPDELTRQARQYQEEPETAAAKLLSPQPGPIPWYLTREATEGDVPTQVQSLIGTLGGGDIPTYISQAKQQAAAVATARETMRQLEDQLQAREKFDPYVDTPMAARRGIEEINGALGSIHPALNVDFLQRSIAPLPEPFGEQPHWQDQPTLGGKVNAALHEANAAIVNFPVQAYNFMTSPIGGALTVATGGLGPALARPIEETVGEAIIGRGLVGQAGGVRRVTGGGLVPGPTLALDIIKQLGIDAQGAEAKAIAQKVHRMVAAGFTVDMIRHGLEAQSLQEGIGAGLGAILGSYGAVRPTPYEAPSARTPAEVAKLEDLPLSIREILEGEYGKPPPVPPYYSGERARPPGRYTQTGEPIGLLPIEADAEVPATGSPSVATATAAKATLPTDQQSVVANAGGVVYVRREEAVVRPELMQYKATMDPKTGRTQEHAETIVGTWDPFMAGLITLWEPIDKAAYGLTGEQKYIVTNGHGRKFKIDEEQVPGFNAQILKESDGVTVRDARIQAAENNIKDGKGTVYDAADFIRGLTATEGADAAMDRARLIGARGAEAAAIAIHSGSDLYDAFWNKRISPQQAAAIAEAVPGNEGLQRVGIDAALKGMKHQDLYNYMQAAKVDEAYRDTGGVPEQVDMFGKDESAMVRMQERAKRAFAIQTEIGERKNAIAGAAKRPERAKALGLDVNDPVALQEMVLKLRKAGELARNWSLNKEVRDLVFREDLTAAQAVEEILKIGEPKAEPGRYSLREVKGGGWEVIDPNGQVTNKLPIDPSWDAETRARQKERGLEIVQTRNEELDRQPPPDQPPAPPVETPPVVTTDKPIPPETPAGPLGRFASLNLELKPFRDLGDIITESDRIEGLEAAGKFWQTGTLPQTLPELQAVARAFGWRVGGNLAELRKRLVHGWSEMRKLLPASVGVLEDLPANVLKERLKALDLKTTFGNRNINAQRLIEWAKKSVASYKGAALKVVHGNAIKAAIADGRPVSVKAAEEYNIRQALEERGYVENAETGLYEFKGKPEWLEFDGKKISRPHLERLLREAEQSVASARKGVSEWQERYEKALDQEVNPPTDPKTFIYDKRITFKSVVDAKEALQKAEERARQVRAALAGEPTDLIDLDTVLATEPNYGPIERLREQAVRALGVKPLARGSNYSAENDARIQAKMLQIAQQHPRFNELFEQRGDRWFHKATGQPILGPRTASKEGWETGMPKPPSTTGTIRSHQIPGGWQYTKAGYKVTTVELPDGRISASLFKGDTLKGSKTVGSDAEAAVWAREVLNNPETAKFEVEPPPFTRVVQGREPYLIREELADAERDLLRERTERRSSSMIRFYEERIKALEKELKEAEKEREPEERSRQEARERLEREREEEERLARESSDPDKVRQMQRNLKRAKEDLTNELLGIGRKTKSKTKIAAAQRLVNAIQNGLDILTGNGLKPGDRVTLVSTGKTYEVLSEPYQSQEYRAGVSKGDWIVEVHDGQAGHAKLFKPLNDVTRIEQPPRRPEDAGRTKLSQKIRDMGVPYDVIDDMAKLNAQEQVAKYGVTMNKLIEAVMTGDWTVGADGRRVGKLPKGYKGPIEEATVETRTATDREARIARQITELLRARVPFSEALARVLEPGETVDVQFIRRLAEEPLLRQADLLEEQNPFNLVGETTKDSGDTADLGQGDVRSENDPQLDLFGEEGRPEDKAGTPGLGAPPRVTPDPADDPNFTALPVDLPEAYRFNEALLQVGISVMRKLKALGGRAAGVFRYNRGHDAKGRIILKADIADLLSEEEKLDLKRQALEFAQEHGQNAREIREIFRERYKFLLDQAYDEAKKGPSIRALRVVWHEIGHAKDWFGANWYKLMGSTYKTLDRGNIFGHIAGLFDYLEDVIALDPFKAPGKKLTQAEKAEMRRQAKAAMDAQVGPMQEIIETIISEDPEYTTSGITTEHILSLINSNTARTEMPDLYRWFAELPGPVKKEIIKAAMRGLLHDLTSRAPAGVRVPTGRMIRTEREVRRTVGRMATQAEIDAKFKEMFEREMKIRNIADVEMVKQELRGAIAWWRGTETIEPYFDNPKEMYAEAFSIFMNNPQGLARRAPTYTRLIWNYMEARPEVANIYQKIQTEIKSGQVKDLTEQAMIDDWARADKRSVQMAQDQALSMTRSDFLDNVIYHYDRRLGPIYRAAKGTPSEGAVRASLGNFNYRQTTHEYILNRILRDVSQPLLKANLDWVDLARIMFYNRIFEERFAKFNPYLVDARRAKDRLDNMRQTMGPQRFAALEKAQRDLRAIYQEMVVGPMKTERMWSKELQDYIDHNIYYATFAVIQEGQRLQIPSIEKFLSDVMGSQIGPQIYRQVGTAKEILNPATATVLKMLSLASATARNTAKRLTVQMLHESQAFPNEKVMEAETKWNGTTKRREYRIVDTPNVGTVVYMQDGKPQAFYVRRVIADGLNHGNHTMDVLARAAAEATGWLKSGYTQLSYGFWPGAFIKDTLSFWVQMHGRGGALGKTWQQGATTNMPPWMYWLSTLEENVGAARATIKATANPHADAALKRRMIISRADPRGIWSAVDNMHEVQLASYGLNPARWTKEGHDVNRAVKAWNSYREIGQILERTNKIAGMRYLDERYPGMPEWKRAEIVRERAGSPDFLQRGASNPQVDFFWLFYNPWKEGVRSLTRAFRDNPFSFTAKATTLVAAPSVLQAVAASGGFGNDLQRMYRSIGDYDLSNYWCVPLAYVGEDKRKVLYFRFPLWESARIMHSALWSFTTGRSQGLAAAWGGQLPSMSSLLAVASMFAVYEIAGKNPYSYFRGKYILDDNTFKAGGWQAQKALLKEAWNQMPGAGLLYRFQNMQIDTPPQGKLEKFLQMPGVQGSLGRFFKVSDIGIRDIDEHIISADEKFRAQTRLAVQEIQRKLLNKQPLRDNEKLLMREPYANRYFWDTFQENATAFLIPEMKRLEGRTPEQKAMILEKNPPIYEPVR